VQLVGALEALGVAIEGVGVLHDELARAQHPGARARLVALLRLEVVEHHRQVAVGAHGLGHVEGHDLLMSHGQHHLRPPAVLQAELLCQPVASCLLPQLGWVHDRHQQLLGADGVELLAHDLHRLLMGPPARGQPGPEAGAELADEPGAHHQLVRERLGVTGRLLLGGQQVAGQARHRDSQTSGGPGAGASAPAPARRGGLRCE
jgi:hypothetical protein